VRASPSQAPTEGHPSADEITTLVDTARATSVSLEDFGDDMRRLINLSPLQKITKKYLQQHMTMSEYEIARSADSEKWRVILEEDVPNHEPPAPTTAAAEPADPPATEDTSAVPSAAEASSAPGPDPDAAARDALVREAVSLGLPEAECRHVMTMHNDLEKARITLTASTRKTVQAA
jgi:hypothetical protein